jgi:hypothetical protein
MAVNGAKVGAGASEGNVAKQMIDKFLIFLVYQKLADCLSESAEAL